MNTTVLKRLFVIGLILIGFSMNSLHAQFEQKLTLRGSLGYVYPMYETLDIGASLNGGIQYNTKTPISLMANVRFFQLVDVDPVDTYFWNVSLGGGAKLKMFRSKSVSPYIIAEINANFNYYYYWLRKEEIAPDQYVDYYEEEDIITFGFYPGAGIDFKITENIGLFVQSGYYYTYYDNFGALYSLLGVNISFLKSKSL